MKSLGEAESLAEVRERFGRLTAADARVWGVMTVEEMLVHLREAYRLPVQAGPEVGAAAAPLPLSKGLIKIVALKIPLRWPRTIPTIPELKREALPVSTGFDEERARMLEAMEAFVARRDNRTVHPIFGKMEPWDWMRWGYLHADHHLRQFGR